jgi:hypothetical protein
MVTRSARGGTTSAHLDLASALAGDETPSVVQQIGGASACRRGYRHPRRQLALRGVIRQRFAPELTALGLPGDPSDSETRAAGRPCCSWSASRHQPRCSRGRELALSIDNPPSLPATLASQVLNVAAVCDAALYDSTWRNS